MISTVIGRDGEAALYRVIVPTHADFAVDWRAEWFDRQVEPPTWYMADDVVAAGLDGILFPSQTHRFDGLVLRQRLAPTTS